ncbi:hypothetical protein F889_02507 [Acinetobacter colistiniresistens]|uniref:Uncharacterized protein n=1 Tax=Acinetobacter colistiniresistens TaxID=280145 RepID=N9PK42_9GAMM|nr:hypothetical protein F889_02507 [Acinetobacter colistiniresistens]
MYKRYLEDVSGSSDGSNNLQPQDNKSPSRATGKPPNRVSVSPVIMNAVVLCVGQVASSPMHAIGLPLIKKFLFPLITSPPPVVGNPTVIYIEAMIIIHMITIIVWA